MEVFIEYTIIDNMVMDCLILTLTCKLMRVKTSKLKIFIGATIGTIFAIILPLVNLNKVFSFIVKILFAGLICLFSAKHKRLIDFIKFYNVFLLLTFALGGVIFGIMSLMGIDYENRSPNVLPVGVNLLCAVIVYMLIKKVVEKFQRKIETNYVCDCEIVLFNTVYCFKGYVDTGNTLIDCKTGFPVVVCTREVFSKIPISLEPKRYMPITTASGFSSIELYEIDEIRITLNGVVRIKNAMLGVSNNVKKLNSNCELILGAQLL